MAKSNDWKKRDGVVYSTNSDFEFSYGQSDPHSTLPPQQQNLKVMLDKSMRAGKQVTIVTRFSATMHDLENLGKLLKSKCGGGRSVTDGDIPIPGDHRAKTVQPLQKDGYTAKRA